MSGGVEEDIKAQLDRQSAPALHIPDEIRVGVLAGAEEAEIWLQAHLLGCEACRGPISELFAGVQGDTVVSDEGGVDCAQARTAIFNHLEDGREPAFIALQHILICDACAATIYEPAKAATVLEFYPDETGEAG